MYNLFLETRAAAQIREWCRINEKDADELLQAAYKNACNNPAYARDGGFDGYLFERAIKDNSHKKLDIDLAFTWDKTPEGRDVWIGVHGVYLPKAPI